MSSITIHITAELKNQLDELSRRQNRPVNELVCEALRRYLATEGLRTARRATAPLAEAAGYLTDDDLFDAVS